MFSTYLKTAWRSLMKHKVFSAINVFGLGLGIAAFLLIFNYLRFEYSYDDFHQNKDLIFRVPMVVREDDGKEQTFAFTFPAVAPALKKDFPEIENAVRFRQQGGIVQRGDVKMVEKSSIYFTDPSVFEVFSFSFFKGSPETAMRELNDAVITRETAERYFGSEDPIGKALHYRNEDFIVKGVLNNLPSNSHIRFNILLNYNKYIQVTRGRAETSWGWSDFYTYVKLKTGTNPDHLQAKLKPFTQRYLGEDMKQRGYALHFILQPLKDIHLRSRYDYELEGNGDLSYLKYLGIAALFILFIAWINYINLTTAHSMDRSKEVGVRKVIGAGKFQLIRQFLAESFFMILAAATLGVLGFRLGQPFFSKLVNREITGFEDTNLSFWALGLGVFLAGTFLAAFYPAFILSSVQPAYSIKSAQAYPGSKGGKNILRKSLVLLQFIAAMALIAASLGFYRQLRFMQGRDLGIQIDQTLVLQQTAAQDSSDLPAYAAFVNALESNPGILSVTASSSVPGGEVGGSADFVLKNSQAGKRCRLLGIDRKFIDAYGLELLGGRNFSTDRMSSDTSIPVNILVNETAARVFGFTDPKEILAKEIDGGGFHCKIIGLVKDYHQESLQYGFDPIVFYPAEESDMGNFSLKVNTGNLPALMDFVRETWNSSFPESPFQYFFLDEQFNEQYKNDRLFATVLGLFTVIAILIACLGLFGLSLFTIARRTREIGIRKVLGASLSQITGLITLDYLRLVILAGLIALPLAYLLVNGWLKQYAFHIALGAWFFIVPLVLLVLITLVTVSYQSLKAGLADPVKSLRSE